MCSIFILKPAFKTYAEGTIIASGDVVTLQTKKTIAASHYSLHMSNLEELQKDRQKICRALKLDHPYIEGGQEINGVAGEVRPTLFRAMLFSPLENMEPAASETLKGKLPFFWSLQSTRVLHLDMALFSSKVKSILCVRQYRRRCSHLLPQAFFGVSLL